MFRFGATTFINSSEVTDLENHLKEKFGGIDCVGNVPILKTSFAACKPWGSTIIAGVTLNQMELIPVYFICGKKLIGAAYGGFRGKDAVNYFVKRYKSLPLDDIITNYITLDDINKGFDDMGKKGIVKTVVLIK